MNDSAEDRIKLHERATRAEAEVGKLGALACAYASYVALLEESLKGLASFAHVHGWRTPEAMVRRGQELRQRIEELSPADLDAPPPQSKIFRRPIEEGEFEE